MKINQEYDIEDNSFALLTFSRGTVVALDISYTVPDSFPYGRDLYLGLRGTAGVLSWSPSFEGVQENLFVCSDCGEFQPATRRHVEFRTAAAAGLRRPVHACSSCATWRGSIRTGTPAVITGEDGLRALEVVEAIYQSAATGRAVKPAAAEKGHYYRKSLSPITLSPT